MKISRSTFTRKQMVAFIFTSLWTKFLFSTWIPLTWIFMTAIRSHQSDIWAVFILSDPLHCRGARRLVRGFPVIDLPTLIKGVARLPTPTPRALLRLISVAGFIFTWNLNRWRTMTELWSFRLPRLLKFDLYKFFRYYCVICGLVDGCLFHRE